MGMNKATKIDNYNGSRRRMSLKISEHSDNIEKKKNKIKAQPPRVPIDNSSIRFLRPKVYITESSAFKALVQQLTGNGTIITTTRAEHDVPIEPAQKAPVMEIATVTRSHETVASLSFEDYYSSPSDHQPMVYLDESSPCQSDDRSSYNSQELADHPHHQKMMSGSPVDDQNSSLLLDDLDMMSNLLSYQDLESFLLDLAPPEVSVYEYPLTGIF